MTTSDPLPSPWSSAAEHCWTHVAVATRVANIVTQLTGLPVDAVVPIISTISASLQITPTIVDSTDHIRGMTVAISTALGTDTKWSTVIRGDVLCFQLRYADVNIELVTSIPATRPTEFVL